MYDVLIIGAGVIGTSVARYCSEYQQHIAVLEAASDVCEKTSKANSGIVHSGFDAPVGSAKAHFNKLGNRMMKQVCEELDVSFRQNGSLVLAFSEADLPELQRLKAQGEQNGVEGLVLLNHAEVLALEPNLSDKVLAALHAPTGGIVDPFALTMMMAEVASMNGATFHFQCKVERIRKVGSHFEVETAKGTFQSKTVINCAGVYADVLNNQVSQRILSITPRKGEYCLFDKSVGNLVSHTIFQVPSVMGKGVVVSPTAEGNLIVGPSAIDIADKDDISTTSEGLSYILSRGRESVKTLPMPFVITAFAGLRATEKDKDFVIGEAFDCPGFFNAAGIESPGLTASPAIGQYLADLVAKHLHSLKKSSFVSKRTNIVRFESLPIAEKAALIAQNPDYGQIVCRCELVTLAQVKDAIHRPLGATTVDGIKRRTRAGSGRCQGGFCGPKVLEILAKELRKNPREIGKFNDSSVYLVGLDKEMLGE